jgi:hypothetical protein
LTLLIEFRFFQVHELASAFVYTRRERENKLLKINFTRFNDEDLRAHHHFIAYASELPQIVA